MSHVTTIDEHPLPLTVEAAEEFQTDHPQFRDRDEVLHPDELTEKYLDVLAENNDWRVFRVEIYGLESYVFAWNHQLGHGVRFLDEDGSFGSFVHAMMLSAEVVA
jgi:hypothetical protein